MVLGPPCWSHPAKVTSTETAELPGEQQAGSGGAQAGGNLGYYDAIEAPDRSVQVMDVGEMVMVPVDAKYNQGLQQHPPQPSPQSGPVPRDDVTVEAITSSAKVIVTFEEEQLLQLRVKRMNAWHLTRAHCCASLHSCSLCGTGRPRHHRALPRGQGPGPARRVERRHLHPEGGLKARTFPQVGAREVLQAGEEAQGPAELGDGPVLETADPSPSPMPGKCLAGGPGPSHGSGHLGLCRCPETYGSLHGHRFQELTAQVAATFSGSYPVLPNVSRHPVHCLPMPRPLFCIRAAGMGFIRPSEQVGLRSRKGKMRQGQGLLSSLETGWPLIPIPTSLGRAR